MGRGCFGQSASTIVQARLLPLFNVHELVIDNTTLDGFRTNIKHRLAVQFE